MKRFFIFLIAGASIAHSAAASAQQAGDSPVQTSQKPPARGQLYIRDVGLDGLAFNPSGQFLARYRHFEGRDFVAGGTTETVRQRARLGLGVTYGDMVGAMVQFQDVRIWGEERDPLQDFSADGLDLHQGYVRVMPVEGMELRLGRQEIWFENRRLIGNAAFNEASRSFDALRFMFARDLIRVDGFYAKVAERDSPSRNPDGTPFH